MLEGQPLSFRAFAFDPDNPDFIPQFRVFADLTPLEGSDPTVTYQASNVPAGAAFDDVTAIFDWTPGFADVGQYTVSFTATDDGDGTGVPLLAKVEVTIIVVNANRPPVVTPIANQSVERFATLDVPLTATDPDGNPLPPFAIVIHFTNPPVDPIIVEWFQGKGAVVRLGPR